MCLEYTTVLQQNTIQDQYNINMLNSKNRTPNVVDIHYGNVITANFLFMK